MLVLWLWVVPASPTGGCMFVSMPVAKRGANLDMRWGAMSWEFCVRTTGFNSIRTLLARLHYFHAVSGAAGNLALELRLGEVHDDVAGRRSTTWI